MLRRGRAGKLPKPSLVAFWRSPPLIGVLPRAGLGLVFFCACWGCLLCCRFLAFRLRSLLRGVLLLCSGVLLRLLRFVSCSRLLVGFLLLALFVGSVLGRRRLGCCGVFALLVVGGGRFRFSGRGLGLLRACPCLLLARCVGSLVVLLLLLFGAVRSVVGVGRLLSLLFLLVFVPVFVFVVFGAEGSGASVPFFLC